MSEELNRRTFIKAAALAAGPAVISARGANEKINVGWIGVGTRGYYGLMWLHQAAKDDVELTSICDTYEGYIESAQSRMQEVWGHAAKVHKDYRELLADKSIDAVYIMTPEHLHKEMSVAALNAGKHVYLEKPIGHTIEEGWDIVNAWQKSGKVCQIGTQNRSSLLYKKAKEWIAQGMIGDVHYARAFWYRNRINVAGQPTAAWRYEIPGPNFRVRNAAGAWVPFPMPAPNENNTDWNRFLGPAPKRPFDPHRYFQWRLYWDYSNGIATDLMVHQTDIINFMCDKTTPKSVMASGGIYRYTDGDNRDAPDTFSAIFEYPGSFHLNYSSYLGNQSENFGEHILGNEGTIIVENRTDLYFSPETDPGADPKMRARQAIHLRNDAAPEVQRKTAKSDYAEVDGVQAHFKNFIASIKGTEKPVAPPPVGQEAAIGGHLATLSYKQGKRVLWNDQTRKVTFA